jgi:transcriptional regulator with XRE-family HTH domain
MATYGQNFKAQRERLGLTQEDIAERMGLTRQGNLSQYEKNLKFPTPDLIEQHAKALECQPWELLEGVETAYDRLRSGAPAHKTGTVESTEAPNRQRLTQEQLLLRRCERDKARVAATREALGRKVGEIAGHLGDLTAIINRLPWGQTPVARRERSEGPQARRRSRRRPDRKRPTKPPAD